ncbi:nuclease PIN [Sinomonas mesophila]|uniref:nuclease PIN n=1 Tax=Sinomonas mesophila TaxID=1531955 RepID=UPI0009867348|nr:nuclease PIN [Sinomonas mesophila]
MKFRLFPQETAGLELLSSMAQQSLLAVQALSEMFGARRSDYGSLVDELTAIDTRTTELARSLLTQLRTSFVNPLPREDLLVLSENLQLTVERLGGVGELVVLHGLDRLPREAADLLEIVTREAELTVTAMHQLNNLEDLEDYWLDMTRLAKRAEHTHRVWSSSALRELSITSFARTVEVGRELLAASRALRDVATHVGRIIVREA